MKKYILAILASLVFAFMSVSAFAGSSDSQSKLTVGHTSHPTTKIVIYNNNNQWIVVSAYPYDEPAYYNEIMPGGVLTVQLEWPGLLEIIAHHDKKILYFNEYKKDFPPLLCPSGEGDCKPIS